MEKENLEKLRSDIMKSGIPLEIEVSQTLRRDGWLVINQFPFLDEDKKKVKILDILALKLHQGFLLMAQGKAMALLIECKKATDHPWTFYTTSKESDVSAGFSSLIDLLKKVFSEKVPISQILTSHILNTSIKIGTISYIPFKKRNDFFRAASQVTNASIYFQKSGWRFIYYPVIVFDGDMYEFYIDQENLKLQPIGYIQFFAGGTTTKIAPTLIDVVKKTYLSEFLKLVNEEIA